MITCMLNQPQGGFIGIYSKIFTIILISNLVITNSYSTVTYIEKGKKAKGIVYISWNNNSNKKVIFDYKLIANAEKTRQISVPAYASIRTEIPVDLTRKFAEGDHKDEYCVQIILDKAKIDTQKKYHFFNNFGLHLYKMGVRKTNYTININIDEKLIIQVTDHNRQVLLTIYQYAGILQGLSLQKEQAMASYIDKNRFNTSVMKKLVVMSGKVFAIPDEKIVRKSRKIIKYIKEGAEESKCIRVLQRLINKFAPHPSIDILLNKIMYEAACKGYSKVFAFIGNYSGNWCVMQKGYTVAQAVANHAPVNSGKILSMIKDKNLTCLTIPDKRNMSPAMYATRSLNTEAIDFFRKLSKENNKDYFGTPIFDAKGTPWNAYKILRRLSHRYPNNDKYLEYYEYSKDALRNAVEFIVSLRDFKAIYNIHKQKKNRFYVKRALRLAGFMGNDDVIKFLAQKNPGAEFINSSGDTKGLPALAFAIQNGQLSTIKLLIHLKANLAMLNGKQILELFDNIVDRQVIPRIIKLIYSNYVINSDLASKILNRHGFSFVSGNNNQGLLYNEIVQSTMNISSTVGKPVRLINLD